MSSSGITAAPRATVSPPKRHAKSSNCAPGRSRASSRVAASTRSASDSMSRRPTHPPIGRPRRSLARHSGTRGHRERSRRGATPPRLAPRYVPRRGPPGGNRPGLACPPPASIPRSSPRSSTPSSRPRPRAPASAWPSFARSSTSTAAASPSTRRRAKARRCASCFRGSSRAARPRSGASSQASRAPRSVSVHVHECLDDRRRGRPSALAHSFFGGATRRRTMSSLPFDSKVSSSTTSLASNQPAR